VRKLKSFVTAAAAPLQRFAVRAGRPRTVTGPARPDARARSPVPRVTWCARACRRPHWLWPTSRAFASQAVAVGRSPVVARLGFTATSLRPPRRALRRPSPATALSRRINRRFPAEHYGRRPVNFRTTGPTRRLPPRRHRVPRRVATRLLRSGASLEVFGPFSARWPRSRCVRGRPSARTIPLRRFITRPPAPARSHARTCSRRR
jgi:hypothetical protein